VPDRWVVVTETVGSTFPPAITVLEAEDSVQAADEVASRLSVVALRRGVDIEVFAVGMHAGRWHATFERPEARSFLEVGDRVMTPRS
jgi:hypothetical protein